MKNKKIKVIAFGIVVIAALVGYGVVHIARTYVAGAVTTYPPSILCVPNTCQDYDNNSIQDVELKRSLFSGYSVAENTSTQNMQRINLVIAKQKQHRMQAVTVGVYATDDVLKSGTDLSITPDETEALCEVDRSVTSASGLVVVTVGNAVSSRMALAIKGAQLCARLGPGGSGFVIHLDPSDFSLNSGINLQETKVTFGYNTTYYDSTDSTYDELGTVAFKMKLAACTGNAACRRYAGLIRANTDAGYDESLSATRNYALEGDDSNDYTSKGIGIGGTQLYSREYFEYGLECSYNSEQTKKINIYDLNDNEYVSSKRDLVGVVLQKYVVDSKTNTGGWVVIPKSDVTVIDESGTMVDLDNDVKGLDSRNPRLYGLTGDDWVFIPKYGNRKAAQLSYTMQPKTRYRLMVQPNGFSNFFAIGVPGDAIYGLVGCDVPQPPPVVPAMSCVIPDTAFAAMRLNTPGVFSPAMILTNVGAPPPTFEYSIHKLGVAPTFASAPFVNTVVPPIEQHVVGTVGYTPTSMGTYVMEWRVTAGGLSETCTQNVPIGDQPYFKVYGGDILAGISLAGGVPSSASIISWNQNTGTYSGAGSQLAALASGAISHFISNSDLIIGAGDPSALAFADTYASGTKYGGDFGHMPIVQSYIDAAVTRAGGAITSLTSATLDVASLASGIYDYTGAGNLTIYGSLVANKNVTIIVRNGGSVYVSGPITYGPYDLNTVPQLNVYTTENIIVDNDVNEIHGIYVAEGPSSRFYACGLSAAQPIDYTAMASSTIPPTLASQCDDTSLTVYGSVVAHEVVLSRTGGSWANGGSPSETFKHSPEAWLSRPFGGTGSGDTFDNYISLPPVL